MPLDIHEALYLQREGRGEVWAEDCKRCWYRIFHLDPDASTMWVKAHDVQRGWFIAQQWEYRPNVQKAA